MESALETTYHDVSRIIDRVVRTHYRRFGGHFEDLRANANQIFIEAYETFQATRGSFENWLAYKTRIQLLSDLRLELCRKSRYEDECEMESIAIYDPNPFDVEDFIGGLSSDAASLVRIVFNMPEDVSRGVNEDGGRERGAMGAPRTYAGSLKRYLKDKMGWGSSRISKTFNEIQGAL